MIYKLVHSLVIISLLAFIYISFENVYASSNTNIYTFSIKDDNYKNFKKYIKRNNYTVNYEVPEIKVIQLTLTDKQYKKIKKDRLISDYKLTNSQPDTITYNNKFVYNLIKNINNFKNNFFMVSYLNCEWDLNTTNTGYAYPFKKVFSNSKIAILDSGISKKFRKTNNISKDSKNLVPKYGYNKEDVRENGDTDNIQDKSGHGTFVASQIVGGNGIYPNTHLIIYRTTIHGSGDPLWTINGIVKATKDNANIINISNGMYFNTEQMSLNDKNIYEAYRRAIHYAQDRNKLIVVAAGNNHLNFDNTNHEIIRQDIPSNFKNVITVSSVNKDNQLSSFSNYGKGYIDIAAPTGETDLDKQKVYGIKGYNANNKLTVSNGTSFAAPKVSGALAFIMDKYELQEQPILARNLLYNDAKTVDNYSYETHGYGTLYLSQ